MDFLPQEFLKKMENLLGNEYYDFLKSYDEVRTQGLRVNSLKISVAEFLEKSPFTLEHVPWATDGFYYGLEDQPGKHPYHEAGLYYIQEPSAMAVGEVVNPRPREKVLDLCAAPGGKTTHIATKLKGEGLLLANEIHSTRAKILSQNIERMGIKNAVVTNETPARLAQRFPNYFDKVLVDAPCSGEGMFRKNPQACLEWKTENVDRCRERQLDILDYAKDMLKPGGRLIYSTCTFSPEENEGVVSQFLKLNPNFELEDIEVYEGFSKGCPNWAVEHMETIEKTIRIWPHKVRGEGHYIAMLRKVEGEGAIKLKYAEGITDSKLLKDYLRFTEECLSQTPRGKYMMFGNQLYIIPDQMLSLDKLKVLRPGWHLGTIKRGRFKPSHALALSLSSEDVRYNISFDSDSREIIAYLQGETISVQDQKGWYLVEVDGYSIGWGKLSNDILKNHYPKGLRWRGKI